jgi:peptidoglycan/LPS O-acetylase OafA/YrhL
VKGSTPRDDQVRRFTRGVAAVVIVILAFAWIVLFAFPDDTGDRFAWTIDSHMTAMVMGAGYGSALYFFVRVLTERRWHRVALGFLPTTVFTWMMLGATLLHWDRFRHGSVAFVLWFWIYLITPLLVPGVWLMNRGRDPMVPEERDATFPRRARRGMVVVGAGMLAIAAWMYLWPESAIAVWPWTLTPLTARAVAAFVALPGVAWLAMAADGRWSAARVTLTTVAVGSVLLLVAVTRAWDEFDHASLLTVVYVVGLLGTLGILATLGLWMRGLAHRGQESQGP